MKILNNRTIKVKKSVSSEWKRGFTLLFATLMSGLLLAIATGIFSIVFKELTLTASVKESQFAFYSADSATECALFWDLRGKVFATSSASSPTPSGTNCNEQDITLSSQYNVSVGPSSAVTTFNLTFPPNPHCATVIVTKNGDDTTIESRGYNTCDTFNPRRVERGLRVVY